MPIELTEGDPDEYVFIMPEAYDDDFEAVQISVQICTINQFAKWNPAEKTVTFVLVDGVSTGLHRAAVTLDDGSLTTEYQLYVFISENNEEYNGNEDDD